MLELSWAGQKEIVLTEGVKRKFIEDGDSVKLTGCDFIILIIVTLTYMFFNK